MRRWVTLFALLCCLCLSTEALGQKNGFAVNRGINVSHWLSQSGARGKARAAYFTEADVRFLAEAGFDHLRIPVDEAQLFSEDGKKQKEAFALLHNALAWCRKHHLRAIVDLHILRSHHFNGGERPLFTERKEQLRFYGLWEALSAELKRYPNDFLAYELLNEPVAEDHEAWNRIVVECVGTLRRLEPERSLVIGTNRWQGYWTARYLKLPKGDPNLIISFHYYNPFLLTHYKASWTDLKDYPGTVHYPGKPVSEEELRAFSEADRKRFGQWSRNVYNSDVFGEQFRKVVEVGRAYGVPVYCGEFGCVSQAPEPDKTRWYADVVGQLERNGIGWAHWDYKGGFSVGARDKPLTAAWKILTRGATKSIPAGSSAIMVTDMPKGAKP